MMISETNESFTSMDEMELENPIWQSKLQNTSLKDETLMKVSSTLKSRTNFNFLKIISVQ